MKYRELFDIAITTDQKSYTKALQLVLRAEQSNVDADKSISDNHRRLLLFAVHLDERLGIGDDAAFQGILKIKTQLHEKRLISSIPELIKISDGRNFKVSNKRNRRWFNDLVKALEQALNSTGRFIYAELYALQGNRVMYFHAEKYNTIDGRRRALHRLRDAIISTWNYAVEHGQLKDFIGLIGPGPCIEGASRTALEEFMIKSTATGYGRSLDKLIAEYYFSSVRYLAALHIPDAWNNVRDLLMQALTGENIEDAPIAASSSSSTPVACSSTTPTNMSLIEQVDAYFKSLDDYDQHYVMTDDKFLESSEPLIKFIGSLPHLSVQLYVIRMVWPFIDEKTKFTLREKNTNLKQLLSYLKTTKHFKDNFRLIIAIAKKYGWFDALLANDKPLIQHILEEATPEQLFYFYTRQNSKFYEPVLECKNSFEWLVKHHRFVVLLHFYPKIKDLSQPRYFSALALAYAAHAGKFDIVLTLLKWGVSCQKCLSCQQCHPEAPYTPLGYALLHNEIGIAERLVKATGTINHTPENTLHPLTIALSQPEVNLGTLQWLLAHNDLSPNIIDCEKPPLHWALLANKKSKLAALIERFPTIEINWIKDLRSLMQQLVFINGIAPHIDPDLLLELQSIKTDIETLQRYTASPEKLHKNIGYVLTLLETHHWYSHTFQNGTPIMVSLLTQLNDDVILHLYESKKIDFHAPLIDGNNIFHWMATTQIEQYGRLVRLYESAKDLTNPLLYADHLFVFAVIHGQFDIANRLLALGVACTRSYPLTSYTAAGYALMHNNIDMVIKLIERIGLNYCLPHARHLLTVAIEEENYVNMDTFNWLISLEGVDPNIIDDGKTALWRAVQANATEKVARLLEVFPKIDLTFICRKNSDPNKGQTLIEIATANENADMLELLTSRKIQERLALQHLEQGNAEEAANVALARLRNFPNESFMPLFERMAGVYEYHFLKFCECLYATGIDTILTSPLDEASNALFEHILNTTDINVNAIPLALKIPLVLRVVELGSLQKFQFLLDKYETLIINPVCEDDTNKYHGSSAYDIARSEGHDDIKAFIETCPLQQRIIRESVRAGNIKEATRLILAFIYHFPEENLVGFIASLEAISPTHYHSLCKRLYTKGLTTLISTLSTNQGATLLKHIVVMAEIDLNQTIEHHGTPITPLMMVVKTMDIVMLGRLLSLGNLTFNATLLKNVNHAELEFLVTSLPLLARIDDAIVALGFVNQRQEATIRLLHTIISNPTLSSTDRYNQLFCVLVNAGVDTTLLGAMSPLLKKSVFIKYKPLQETLLRVIFLNQAALAKTAELSTLIPKVNALLDEIDDVLSLAPLSVKTSLLQQAVTWPMIMAMPKQKVGMFSKAKDTAMTKLAVMAQKYDVVLVPNIQPSESLLVAASSDSHPTGSDSDSSSDDETPSI